MKPGPVAVACLALLRFTLAATHAAEPAWTEIPASRWAGILDAQVPALKTTAAATCALPADRAQALTATTEEAVPPGLYAIQLTLRPSHTHGAVAFHSGLQMTVGKEARPTRPGVLPGHRFVRVHHSEVRTVHAVHDGGPLRLQLSAFSDAKVFGTARVKANLKAGGPTMGAEEDDLGLELDLTLKPEEAVYLLVDRIAYRPLSQSGQVTRVTTDKIRYRPGETLKGTATLVDVGRRGGHGKLNLYLEHNVRDRVRVKTLDVTLARTPQTLTFSLPLPQEELGYALVAEFVSADGRDRAAAAEYFNIATQFQRVALVGGAGLATRDAIQDEDSIRRGLAEARSGYCNAVEYPFWAPDDMVEMSPDRDFWSSGQANYRMNKQTIQRQIRLAHEVGIAVISYGKFVMSGFPGWQTAYDYPNDHRGQYNYHIGTWSGVNVPILDRLRDRDVRVYSKAPRVRGNAFHTWWAGPQWINPDTTPQCVRLAAEECVRAIQMFGWDMIRWDGHPRGGGHWVQCGRSGKYQAWAARRTQSLVRYFKAIVNRAHPDFGHGYNYLLIEKNKGYDWALEDFELDELCRGGGLLMNESIGNASAGWTFEQIVGNLQVDGDLCRERGGYYQGISFGERNPPRDVVIESALWAAAGARPYNSAMSRAVRRYCTRYSQYTLDERLRRLATPEKVLAPEQETRLWWQPFVYETPLENGTRRLVVNLLNIPRTATRPAREGEIKPEYDMPPGTAPVRFALTLPQGLQATAVHHIDPQDLTVTPLSLQESSFSAPPVASWEVVIIDLKVAAATPALASRWGPPTTLGRKREALETTARRPEVLLDPKAEIWEVNKRMGTLAPDWEVKAARQQAELDALQGAEREKALLARRPSVDTLQEKWWKGAAIPDDRKLMDAPPAFGDLTPTRNSRVDIFYARGAMDYRLRMAAAFAGLERLRVHDAPLWGAVARSIHTGLAGGVGAERYPEFDVLLFTGVTHPAIGVKNCWGLVDYVKAGGAAFFTGGEFAFGKGGYMHTVLERELLPLQMTAMQDTVYTRVPQPFQPGPDLAALGVELDFSAEPAFWVRNEVVLKPTAKVFLKSGDRPVLVGWELGRGRVACLLVDHRGRSQDGVTAFFDWAHWPRLVEAVLTWLAPEAGKTHPASEKPAPENNVLARLQEATDGDLLGDLDALDEDEGAELGLPAAAAPRVGTELEGEKLTARVALIDKALRGAGPELAAALASQLGTVINLPLRQRLAILTVLQSARPANANALGEKALTGAAGVLHANGYWLRALAGDEAFVKTVANPPPVRIENEVQRRERHHDLALAITLYPKADLVARGRARVKTLNEQEDGVRAAFAKVCGKDTAMLETSPCLSGDDTFERLAWLAYLSRHTPATHGEPFLREWLRIDQYRDYCSRTAGYLPKQNQMGKAAAAACRAEWRHLATRLRVLGALTQADARQVLSTAPAGAGRALAAIRFSKEARRAINLLGDERRSDKTLEPILAAAAKARHPDLAAFARARQEKAP